MTPMQEIANLKACQEVALIHQGEAYAEMEKATTLLNLMIGQGEHLTDCNEVVREAMREALNRQKVYAQQQFQTWEMAYNSISGMLSETENRLRGIS